MFAVRLLNSSILACISWAVAGSDAMVQEGCRMLLRGLMACWFHFAHTKLLALSSFMPRSSIFIPTLAANMPAANGITAETLAMARPWQIIRVAEPKPFL